MFKKKPIDTQYISPIDKALAKFNATHRLTPAQQDEVDKYKRIYQLRDHAITPKKVKDIWDLSKNDQGSRR
jgi:hypothetical protein